MNTLAIDIGGTKFSVALFRNQSLAERKSGATDRSGGPQWMVEQIHSAVREWLEGYEIDGCGIGFGGPVDFPGQRVICSTHVPGWDDYDLINAIRRRMDIPAVVDRDTMVGALGEGYFGAGVGQRPLFYMTISTGIGGGLLTDEGLYHGADSFSCEIGHHTVNPGGPECLCGARGCLERMCSGLWLERDYGRPASELLKDPVFVERYVVPLARGLKNCIMFLNPARIVIGGGISKAGTTLFSALQTELMREIPAWSRARIDVVPAELGDDSVLWGALALAETRLYQRAQVAL